MRTTIVIFATVIALASCGTAKHVQRKEVRSVSADSVMRQAKQDRIERAIDTTRFENGTATITEIYFFDEVPNFDHDTTTAKGESVKSRVTNAVLPNVGSLSGVKKIRQTTIVKNTVQKGESRQIEESQSSLSANVNRKEDSSVMVEKKASPHPFKWRYVFYLSVVSLIVLLILKHSSLLTVGKKFCEFFKRIF